MTAPQKNVVTIVKLLGEIGLKNLVNSCYLKYFLLVNSWIFLIFSAKTSFLLANV